MARLANDRGKIPAEPLRLRAKEPAIPLLRSVRSSRYECELPDALGHDDRAPGADTAQQQLAIDSARALAARVEREARPEFEARIIAMFRLVYSRDPDRTEVEIARSFLARDPSLSHLGLALMNANEFVYID